MKERAMATEENDVLFYSKESDGSIDRYAS